MAQQIKRTIVLITDQKQNPSKDSGVEGFPMRDWSIELWLLTDTGERIPANCFEKVTYRLHPTFKKRAIQAHKEPPFRVAEEGWGEFDMQIVPMQVGKTELEVVQHDLNFREQTYETTHEVTFKNPNATLLNILSASGPVPEANGASAAASKPDTGKRKRANKNVDMEKLADGLQKLNEDDLLHVVQLVHEHKSAETYSKNDVENGEFHVDLYTLPDNLVKMLWDFAEAKGGL